MRLTFQPYCYPYDYYICWLLREMPRTDYPLESEDSACWVTEMTIYKDGFCNFYWHLSTWLSWQRLQAGEAFYKMAARMFDWVFRLVGGERQ